MIYSINSCIGTLNTEHTCGYLYFVVESTTGSKDGINITAIAVSAVSLLLVGTFVLIIAAQCVFIARGRGGNSPGAAKRNDVTVSSNEAYATASFKMKEEAIYETMK